MEPASPRSHDSGSHFEPIPEAVHALRKPRPGRGKNFITEVLLPSLFSKKAGVRHHTPIFPGLPYLDRPRFLPHPDP